MPASQALLRAPERPESKALVVATSAVQLGFVVLVWLLALPAVALMALAATGVQAVRRGVFRTRP